MKFFTRTEPITEPPQTDEERLAGVLRDLHIAERELASRTEAVAAYGDEHKDMRVAYVDGNRAVLVGAMTHDPIRQRLESDINHARVRFHKLLAEHAALKIKLGLTR